MTALSAGGYGPAVALADLSDPDAVRAALDERDRIGERAFLEKYKSSPATRYVVTRDGMAYDSKAVVAAAHGYQFGTPLDPTQFSGGAATVVPKLRELGFDVVDERLSKPTKGQRRSLFQANPKIWDLRNALEVLPTLQWVARQSFHRIKAGHAVHFWEAGPTGGVLARGRILTDPTEESEEASDKAFALTDELDTVERRVWIAIEQDP